MKTLLRLDASLHLAESYTRRLTQHFEQAWQHTHPNGQVIRRCLVTEPIPHLDESALAGFRTPSEQPSLSDKLIEELRQANHVLIGCPVYNYGVASTLKAYFDHVVRPGVTIERTDHGWRGMLDHLEATVALARGEAPLKEDPVSGYVEGLLRFIGVQKVTIIKAEHTMAQGDDALSTAKEEISSLLRPEGAAPP